MNYFYSPNIRFMIENVSFCVSNIAREQFKAPVPEHAHGNSSYELHYISSGYGTVRANGTVYKLVPHMLYITGPHVAHEQVPYIDNPMTEYSVFFHIQKDAAGPSSLDPFLQTPFWMMENASDLHPLLKEAIKELQHKRDGYIAQASSLIQQTVVFLMRSCQTPRPAMIHTPTSGYTYASRAFLTDKAFLYEYRDITLERLSQYLDLSGWQTERFLKDYYGRTFAQKRLDARMSAACILLRADHPDLQKITEQTGYTSADYFVNAFKKYHGITPKRYIQLVQQEREEREKSKNPEKNTPPPRIT